MITDDSVGAMIAVLVSLTINFALMLALFVPNSTAWVT
jgi:hypothetical protein